MGKINNRIINIEFAGTQALFWMDFCIAVSFAANYMQAKGFSNTELGAVLALGNVLGFLIDTGISSAIDRYREITVFKAGTVVLLLQTAALILLSAFGSGKGTIAVFYTAYIAFCLCVNGLNNKLCVDLQHGGYSVNYGVARGTGSISFAIMSFLMGSVLGSLSVNILPAVGLALAVLQLVLYRMLQRQAEGTPGTAEDEKEHGYSAGEGTSLMGFFRKYPAFALLLFGNIFVFGAHNAVGNFMINIARATGGGTETMGGLNGWVAVVELPAMFLYARFSKGRDCGKLLAFAYAMFICKILAVALADTVPLAYAAFTLQACSYALYAPAIIQYTDEAVPFEDSAKAQNLAYGVTVLGSTAASLLAGAQYDVLPVRSVVLIWTGICAVGAVISICAIRLGKKTRTVQN